MHSWSANVWVLRRETDAPRVQQTSSALPLGPSSARAASAGLAWTFLGEASASAVNRSGSHNARLARSGQILRDDVGPTAHNTALGHPGARDPGLCHLVQTYPKELRPTRLRCCVLLRHLGLGKLGAHPLALGWFCTASQLDQVGLPKLNPHM